MSELKAVDTYVEMEVNGEVIRVIPYADHENQLAYEDYRNSEACRLSHEEFERWRAAGMFE